MLAPLEAPDAAADAIRGAFASDANETDGWGKGTGCLMCSTAVERAALDELAAFVSMSLIGVVALIRAQAEPTIVRAAAEPATAPLG